jgi:hypothetical protein
LYSPNLVREFLHGLGHHRIGAHELVEKERESKIEFFVEKPFFGELDHLVF